MLRIRCFELFVAGTLLAFCGVVQADDVPPPPKPLDYPNDLRNFRKKALLHDGYFAPDIAFVLRTCPNCHNIYVMGTFPRLKREPFDSVDSLHELLMSAVKKERPKTMFSTRLGRQIPRSCPVCLRPEAEGPAERVLFCHLTPETGDDMELEYELKDPQLLLTHAWKLPRKSGDVLAFDDAVDVKLAAENEDSILNAYGAHFSLRAVWNEIMSANADATEASYQKIGPGMWFIFKPRSMLSIQFRAYAEKTLKPDREIGLWQRLEPVVIKTDKGDIPGSYRVWAPKYEAMLSAGEAECFVAISYEDVRKAAKDVLASRGIALEVTASENKKDPGKGTMRKGGLHLDVEFSNIGARAAVTGVSLHEACALYLADPAFVLESAIRLDQAFRKALPGCTFEIRDGRFLVAHDGRRQERKIDLGNLADKLDPDEHYLFDLYCRFMLSWNKNTNAFGKAPEPREISPAGLPAFLDRRIRPKGHLKEANKPQALFEPREDSDGNRFDLCYTMECTQTLTFLDTSLPRFKDITLEECQQMYPNTGGILPMFVAKEDSLSLPGRASTLKGPEKLREFPCKVVLLYGMDLASLGTDAARASELARMAGLLFDDAGRFQFYALSTDTVALSPRRLNPDEMKMVELRMNELLDELNAGPGMDVKLHFDLARTEPKGMIIKRTPK